MKAITGNTYPVKDKLRAMGGKWDGQAKAWLVPDDKAAEALALVASAPKKAFGATSSYRPSRCRECGCAGSQYNPIYRNGVCKDCYVSEREEREMGY